MNESDATPAVEVVENLWIPLADGTRLAARLWRPADAATRPVPAVLEYIPYRKRDGTRGRDEPMHGFFAAQGYAALRVDMRGSGESDGFLDDEYLRQEQDDAIEVIAWIAAQPWCSGAVGMMGKSWGGFNALQVAARRPPALKAIITVCSTDDRFADDIHFMGGCLLNDNLWWGSIMLAYQARPPDPEIVGKGWRKTWLDRLDRMPFWPRLWLEHQSRDAYWRHGSVCEDFSAIACPALVVGGWADAYTSAVPRLLEGLAVPRLGIVGPWAHIYPQDGVPGPAIDFLGEATRWWNTWLKGEDTGMTAEPMLRAFIEDHAPPATTRTRSSGRFVSEPVWPSPTITGRTFHLDRGRLVDAPPAEASLDLRSPLWTGSGAGEWMGTGVAGERPPDQRPDDGLSLCFDGEPLWRDLEILGNPVVELDLAADRPEAQIAVRLCDVSPEGASLRVSYAVLNLAHRDGSADPRPLVPGERVRIRLLLKTCGHRFPVGHRIRLAVSTAYWPLVWPARDATTMTLGLGRSALTLPVRPAGGEDAAFPPPRHGPTAPQTRVRESRMERRVSHDLIARTVTTVTRGEGGLFGEGVVRWDGIGTTLSHDLTRTLTIGADDPFSAEARIEQRYTMERPGWSIAIETEAVMTGTVEAFRLTGTLRAFEDGDLVAERHWDESIMRRHV
ncbi:MAG TPA: CocE/NonD family hydrolase [Lichenihabitans sp.]|nr:CocE/NonD family hydrolase [Lichenihabitans sp.]